MTNKNRPLVIIGISSGIAAYKIVDLIKILKSREIGVEIIMTKTAVSIFGKEMFEKAAGKKIYTDLITTDFDYKQVLKNREVEHIKLADSTSLFVVAPATANIIAKLAYGFADDFLTTTVLATTTPILICPSMNVHMWENSIVQSNIRLLRKLGYYIMIPASGRLACGYDGIGRLPEVNIIAKEIFHLLQTQSKLQDKKILVTAGATSEPIDVVRTISNRGSGKMGLAIAEECIYRKGKVMLLRSSDSIEPRINMGEAIFETSDDLENLIKKYVGDYDVLFHCAAVSDFIPVNKIKNKLNSRKSTLLRLKPRSKIIDKVKNWNPKIKLIGFKAVYKMSENDIFKEGLKKLKESGADYIIVNDVGKEGIGFGADDNEVYVISQKGLIEKIDKSPKRTIARILLDIIFPENI